MGKRWYVVEAFPWRDALAAERLLDLGVEAWRPMLTVYRADRRARSRRPIHKKGEPRAKREIARFPPFVFVNCELDETGSMRRSIEQATTRGGQPLVTRFLCGAGMLEPAIIPQTMIDFYRESVPVSGASNFVFDVGDIVEITYGPFLGFSGVVVSVDTRGWLCVEIELFGRSTPTMIEVEYVRPSEMCLTKSPPGRMFNASAAKNLAA